MSAPLSPEFMDSSPAPGSPAQMKEHREVDSDMSHAEASTRADSNTLVFNSPGTSNAATPTPVPGGAGVRANLALRPPGREEDSLFLVAPGATQPGFCSLRQETQAYTDSGTEIRITP